MVLKTFFQVFEGAIVVVKSGVGRGDPIGIDVSSGREFFEVFYHAQCIRASARQEKRMAST